MHKVDLFIRTINDRSVPKSFFQVKSNIEDGIEFTGYERSRILLDPVTQRWTVTSLQTGEILLTLQSEVFSNHQTNHAMFNPRNTD